MPDLPSEDEFVRKLRDRGVPDHVIQGGSKALIERWRNFVRQVENGYPLGLDDYRNDLDIRELIAFLGLDSEVAEEDERLRATLTGGDRAVWESELTGAFWVRGFPRNARGELLADLHAEGFI
jgi:hypothetical protein